MEIAFLNCSHATCQLLSGSQKAHMEKVIAHIAKSGVVISKFIENAFFTYLRLKQF